MVTMLWLPRPDRLDFDTGGNMALGYNIESVDYRKIAKALRAQADLLKTLAKRAETEAKEYQHFEDRDRNG